MVCFQFSSSLEWILYISEITTWISSFPHLDYAYVRHSKTCRKWFNLDRHFVWINPFQLCLCESLQLVDQPLLIECGSPFVVDQPLSCLDEWIAKYCGSTSCSLVDFAPLEANLEFKSARLCPTHFQFQHRGFHSTTENVAKLKVHQPLSFSDSRNVSHRCCHCSSVLSFY